MPETEGRFPHVNEDYLLLIHKLSYGVEEEGHTCFGLLPGLVSTGRADRSTIHLFDCEVGIAPMLFGAVVGFSPGQFADFWLGWFGVDIADDDSSSGRAARKFYPVSDPVP